MSNTNYDLEDKLSLLYDSVYNNSLEGCFKSKTIDLKNIELNDIKFSLKHMKYIEKFMSELKSTNLKKIDNNFFICYGKIFPFSLKIESYKNNDDLDKLGSNINTDSVISWVLSKLVFDKLTSNILLPILNFDVTLNNFENTFKNLLDFDKIKDDINLGKITDKFCIKIRENFFKLTPLEKYFEENGYNKFKIIIFQILHTLAIIQDKYPNFRHNNLNLKSIFINSIESKDVTYKLNNLIYKLNGVDLDIKIGNFEKSYLNKRIYSRSSKKIPLFEKKNRYFDIHYFLKSIDKNKLRSEDLDFVNTVLPKKYESMNYLSKDDELFKPKDLLNHKYFKNMEKKTIIKEEKKFKGFKTRLKNFKGFGNQTKLLTPEFETFKLPREKKISKSNKMMTRKLKTSDKKRSKKVSGTRKAPVFKSRKEKKSKNKMEQKGGYKSFKPAYKFELNKPEFSNDERKVYKKRVQEKPKPRIEQPKIIAEQKIYDVSKDKPKHAPYPPNFPPNYIPVPNPYYPIQNNLPYTYKPNQIPVQKFYNISLSNPAGDHTVLHHIFEDMMPSEDRFNFDTVYERMLFLNHMRNIILKEGDGEDMTISGGKADTLLSYIRLLEINPYSTERNPYHDMSSEMMLFRAAYPIRYDREKDFIGIAKQSTGLNIRIYRMSVGALLAKRLNRRINYYNFDVWRDIYYYEHIRENIVKKKISPNFVNLILYTMDKKSNFDWEKMEKIKKDNVNLFNFQQNERNRKTVNLLHDYKKNLSQLDLFLPMKNVADNVSKQLQEKLDRELEEKWMIYNSDKNEIDRVTLQEFKRIRLEEEAKDDITRATNEALIGVTESATSNIIKWASPIYESHGAVKKMVATGFHSDEVWMSVLFQVVSVFLVLDNQKIMFDELSLENNFFIKDLFSDPNNRGYWKYKVKVDIDTNNDKEGFLEYMIPNYGYLVLFDSKYSDLKHTEKNLDKNNLTAENRRYKLYMKQFEDNGFGKKYYDNDNDRKNKLLDQFKNIFSQDNFTKTFKIKGAGMPSERVQNLINSLSSASSLKESLFNNFDGYLNQKAGDIVNQFEKDYINVLDEPDKTSPGELVIYEKSHQIYQWGVIKKVKDTSVTIYLGKEYPEILVNSGSLKKYMDNNVILLKREYVSTRTKKTVSLNPELLIESYNIL